MVCASTKLNRLLTLFKIETDWKELLGHKRNEFSLIEQRFITRRRHTRKSFANNTHTYERTIINRTIQFKTLKKLNHKTLYLQTASTFPLLFSLLILYLWSHLNPCWQSSASHVLHCFQYFCSRNCRAFQDSLAIFVMKQQRKLSINYPSSSNERQLHWSEPSFLHPKRTSV